MTAFPQPPDDSYAVIYLEDSDKPLPEKINQNTRYAYFKTIARGGKSIIQSCKDMHLGRLVCYKQLRPEFENNAIEQRRFLREARVSAMLQHPNTVPTYEIGRDNRGQYFFTMKLVHGYTLREIFDYRERYDLTQLMDVIIQIAQALAYAHSHRVVHRDIKPENILVGPFGEVLLLDWGLAKVWHSDGTPAAAGTSAAPDLQAGTSAASSDITGQGNLEGTITYMSPEQIRRDPDIDYRTDVFSIGAVLYEALCGRPPAEAETVREVSALILEEQPQKPSEHSRVPIPELLESAAMACLHKDPNQRIENCLELVRLLQQDW
ncbi:MAG: serine/threonine protein kinase [Pseudomonadales bacterium]